MKTSHFTFLTVIGFTVIFFILLFVGQNTVAASTSNKEYSMIITNACHDAIKTINTDKTNVFESETDRNKALSVFYKTIVKGLDIDNGLNDERIAEKTPFVLLIDNNGFYLSYNTAFDKYLTEGDTDFLRACTDLNTWSEAINGHIVRYYLNDHVEVITPSGKIISGSLEEVSKEVTFLSDNFYENRNYCIIHCIEDEINYLLNTQSININSWRMGYTVTLAGVTKEDWTRMLKNPTIISFLQGPNKNNFTLTLNVYGYAASEKTKGQLYYSTDGLYYRAEDDLYEERDISSNDKIIKVTKFKDNIGNMETQAQKGNNPDITAFRNE